MSHWYIAGRIKKYSHFGIWHFISLNMQLLDSTATEFLDLNPWEIKTNVHTKTCMPVLIEPLFLTSEIGLSPVIIQQMNG
jgi:hypothetical protein